MMGAWRHSPHGNHALNILRKTRDDINYACEKLQCRFIIVSQLVLHIVKLKRSHKKM